jgi:hypothetical protein
VKVKNLSAARFAKGLDRKARFWRHTRSVEAEQSMIHVVFARFGAQRTARPRSNAAIRRSANGYSPLCWPMRVLTSSNH